MITVTMNFNNYDEMLDVLRLARLESIRPLVEHEPRELHIVHDDIRSRVAVDEEAPGDPVAAEPEAVEEQPEPEPAPEPKAVVKKAQDLADEYGIDAMALPASGSGNRVLVRDVQKAIDSRGLQVKVAPEPSVEEDTTPYTVDDCRISTKYLLDAKGLPVVQKVLGEFEVARVKDLRDEDMSRYVHACVTTAGKPQSDWLTFLSEQKAAS